jgi:hypothetical protein
VYRAAGIRANSIEIATDLADKAEDVGRLIADGVTNLVFVDDNPTQIEGVQEMVENSRSGVRHAVVRAFGFLGSGKSAPGAYARCINAKAKYALTAIDLADQLESWVSYESVLPSLTLDEIIGLIPGLRHPMSAAGGESQLVPGWIFARGNHLSAEQLKRVWMNLGLVQCENCMFFWMVRLALTACGNPTSLSVLEGMHDIEPYMRALKTAPPSLLHEVGRCLNDGMDVMTEGAKNVGADSNGDIAARIALNKQRVQEILGSS